MEAVVVRARGRWTGRCVRLEIERADGAMAQHAIEERASVDHYMVEEIRVSARP